VATYEYRDANGLIDQNFDATYLAQKKVRVGWELCAQAIARDGNEDSLLEEFPNINDKDLEW
jgi:hypothetical protein